MATFFMAPRVPIIKVVNNDAKVMRNADAYIYIDRKRYLNGRVQ